MSEDTFTQIIFPPKPKPVKAATVVSPVSTCTPKYTAYIQEEVYCMPANHWIPMFECVFCKEPKKKLEDILASGLGC